jgi:predicted DNA-binding ribbon-helix-helix protein
MQPESLKDKQFFSKDPNQISEKWHSYRASQNSERLRKGKKKTESITFRLESQVLDHLREEAKRKDVSINTLVSQVARQHTNWYSTATQAGFIPVRKPLMIKLLESQNEEQIKSLAKHVAKSSNKDFILMLRGKYNIHSALDFIETWVRTSGYSYTHNIEDLDYSSRLHILVVQHDMGMRWSLYLAELYKNLFEEFKVRNARFETTDSTMAFEVAVSIEEEEGYSRTNSEGTIEDRYRAGKISNGISNA